MIYFDNAATSYPKPRPVRRAVKSALAEFGGNPGRGGHRLALAAADMVYDCRLAIADFFGIHEPEQIVFTAGATMALNLAIFTGIRRGMHVLISDREHNAVLRPIHRLAKEGIIEYDIYPTAGNIPSAIAERLRPNTGMVITCHVSNVNGFTQPISAIGELCRERGLYFIVDAAQSAGHVPIRLSAIPCDAFCAPAHKGLLGIAGCGFLFLRGGNGLPPFLAGGSGVDSLSLDMPDVLPERYEAGTLPTVAIAALRAGINLLTDRGLDETAHRESTLRRRILEGLSVVPGIRLYEPECENGPLTFTHATIPPERLARLLDECGICVRAGYHCAPLAHRTLGTPSGGSVRISLGYGNRSSEGEKFLRAISSVIGQEG